MRILLLLAPVFLTAIVALFARHDDQPPPRMETDQRAVSLAPATPRRGVKALRPPVPEFRPDDVCAYRFETAGRTRVARDLKSETHLAGYFVVRVLGATGAGWEVALSVRDVHHGERVLRKLEGEVRARMSRTGRISAPAFPADLPERGRKILSAIYRQWQFAPRGRIVSRRNGRLVVRTQAGVTLAELDRTPRLVEGCRRRATNRAVHEIAYRYVRVDGTPARPEAPARSRDSLARSTRDELTRLSNLVARDEARGRELHRVSVRLIELLGRSDGAAEAVADRLRGASCSALERQVLLSSLATAGTPACRRVLDRS